MYFEDFKFSVMDWCARKEIQLSQPQAADLRVLYGDRVVPDELLSLLQTARQPQAPEGPPPAPVGQPPAPGLTDDVGPLFFLQFLLRVDAHPTLTRCFTFRSCVDRMLTMVLVDFADALHLGALRGKSPRTGCPK